MSTRPNVVAITPPSASGNVAIVLRRIDGEGQGHDAGGEEDDGGHGGTVRVSGEEAAQRART